MSTLEEYQQKLEIAKRNLNNNFTLEQITKVEYLKKKICSDLSEEEQALIKETANYYKEI